jgi:hypothetical protein
MEWPRAVIGTFSIIVNSILFQRGCLPRRVVAAGRGKRKRPAGVLPGAANA